MPAPTIASLLFCLGLTLLGPACGETTAHEPEHPAAAPEDVVAELAELIEALTPPPATVNSGVRNEWFVKRREMLKTMSAAGPELGRAALAEFQTTPEELLDVRRGLLEVAASNLGEEIEPQLVDLVGLYGADIGIRTKACELLAVASPAKAVELLEEILSGRAPAATYPPDEIMVTSYHSAALSAGIDPVPLLSTIAIDLYAEQTARLNAAKALGQHPGVLPRETLRTVLVESTGNAYLRRTAAQSLVAQAKVDPETAGLLCDIFYEVMNREADLNFQGFMVSMIEKHCP